MTNIGHSEYSTTENLATHLELAIKTNYCKLVSNTRKGVVHPSVRRSKKSFLQSKIVGYHKVSHYGFDATHEHYRAFIFNTSKTFQYAHDITIPTLLYIKYLPRRCFVLIELVKPSIYFRLFHFHT